MVDASVTAAEIPAVLEEVYPGWRVWRSRQGEMWNATRLRHLTGSEERRGLSATLLCTSREELAARLADQGEREARLARLERAAR